MVKNTLVAEVTFETIMFYFIWYISPLRVREKFEG